MRVSFGRPLPYPSPRGRPVYCRILLISCELMRKLEADSAMVKNIARVWILRAVSLLYASLDVEVDADVVVSHVS